MEMNLPDDDSLDFYDFQGNPDNEPDDLKGEDFEITFTDDTGPLADDADDGGRTWGQASHDFDATPADDGPAIVQ